MQVADQTLEIQNVTNGQSVTIYESACFSICRVVATIAVVLIHIGPNYTQNTIASMIFQIGGIAVPIFFVMSGMLVGLKWKSIKGKWLFKKLKRILVPYYVVLITVIFVKIVTNNKINLATILVSLLNLQGVTELRYSFDVLGPTWFISILMICYLITPLLNKVKGRLGIISTVLLAILLQLLAAKYCSSVWGGYMAYILLYLTSFLVFKIWDRNELYVNYYKYLFLSIFTLIGRLISKIFFDGTYIYDGIIAPYFTSIAAFSIVMYALGLFSVRKIIIKNKLILKFLKFIDFISYEIYLVHYLFIYGTLSLIGVTGIKVLDILAIIIVIILTANFLHELSNAIMKVRFHG